MRTRCPRQNGFTLIELLLSLAIFTLVMAMAGGAFWGILQSWRRGGEMLEQLHYGEYVMEQMVSALRSAAWFPSKPEAFGFLLDDNGGTSEAAANEITWTTSGTAFLPTDSPYRNGLHRLSVTVEGSGEARGLMVRAWPHLVEEVDPNQVEAYKITQEVRGFSCEWYDFEGEDWSQEWEETNSLPKLVRITLNMKPRENQKERFQLQRIVELEVAPELPGKERNAGPTSGGGRGRQEDAAGGSGNAAGVNVGPRPGGSGEAPSSGARQEKPTPSNARPNRNNNRDGANRTIGMDGGALQLRGGGR